jgi:hypothetical protein
LRKHGPNPDVFTVAIGGDTLTDHVLTEAWALVNTEQPSDAAGYTSSDATEDTTNWARCLCALSRTLRCAADDALSVSGEGQTQ